MLLPQIFIYILLNIKIKGKNADEAGSERQAFSLYFLKYGYAV